MTLELDRVFSGPLAGASLAVAPGLTVVLASPEDGGAELPKLFAGAAPKSGQVRAAGRRPADDPALRARLGVVLAEEPALEAASVQSAVARVLRLRNDPADARALIALHGLEALAQVSPLRLDSPTRRHLAWALAASVRDPVGLVVHEPLALGPFASRERTRAALAEVASAGLPVLAITRSPRDAAELGGSLVILDQGRFVRRPGAPLATELCPGAGIEVSVRTNQSRALARALLEEQSVSRVTYDGGASDDELRVRGSDADEMLLSLMRCASRTGVELLSIAPVLPGADAIRGATAGLWRAAYDHAYRKYVSQAQAVLPAPPSPAQEPSPAQAREPLPASEAPAPPEEGEP